MADKKPIEPGTCGWAPGNYSCRCHRCGDEFIGDKQAMTCIRCAELLQVMAECLDDASYDPGPDDETFCPRHGDHYAFDDPATHRYHCGMCLLAEVERLMNERELMYAGRECPRCGYHVTTNIDSTALAEKEKEKE